MEIRQHYALDPELAEKFWKLYDETFSYMRKLAAARQSLYHDEFMEDMIDDRVLKYVLWNEQPLGLAWIYNDLKACRWISPEYYEERFPEAYAEGRLHYFGAFLIVPHAQSEGNGKALMVEVVNDLMSKGGVALFDTPNLTSGVITQLVTDESVRQGEIIRHEVDNQHYYAYEILGFKPGFSRGNPYGTAIHA